ncbi:hypothetical protein OUZ56_024048 [Daphnia magna]|uniref:Uncharacterized protein n=1 Tax=Daphnia magna TaxID=35525 RepID=A0ABR0B002_9CRUS|nr:hypothetical protein OUZ56_024048 [Daphnia magna]
MFVSRNVVAAPCLYYSVKSHDSDRDSVLKDSEVTESIRAGPLTRPVVTQTVCRLTQSFPITLI